MTNPSIAAIGAYTPRLRISAEAFGNALGQFDAPGIKQKAVPDADEDALTMAYEAAQRALDKGGYESTEIVYLALATSTPPMEEEDLTVRLASMLGVPDTVTTRSVTGSTRAGAQAFDAALDTGPWDEGIGVIVASDCPRGSPDSSIEHAAGAGAAAFVLDEEGPVSVDDRSSYIKPYPGTRFRSHGNDETTDLGITQYNREAFITTLNKAASELTIDTASLDAASVQSPDGKLPYRAADVLGVSTDTIATAETVSEIGDTGAASTLIGAAKAVSKGAERVLLAAYGSGSGANMFVLTVEANVPLGIALEGDTELSYTDYLRRRGEITSGDPAGGGAYISVPTWRRSIPQRHRLIAGRCPRCDALNFPPSGACQSCTKRPDEFESIQLPGTGTVEAVTTIAQGGAPPEFIEQQAQSGPFVSAVVALDGPHGEQSVSAPVQVLTGGDESVSVGSQVDMTIRRIYEQENVIRYGFKAQLAHIR